MTDSEREISIRPASRGDTEVAASVLAAAFATDPHTVGLLPNSDTSGRLRRLFGLIVTQTMDVGGHVYLAWDSSSGHEQAVGAALWDEPGATTPVRAVLRSIPTYLRVYGARIVDAVFSDHAANSHRPAEPHWYLKAIGTLPSARGRGVASALVRERISRTDASVIGTYLESSTRDNVPFYEKHGFVERSLIPARGTTPSIGMWRPASAAR